VHSSCQLRSAPTFPSSVSKTEKIKRCKNESLLYTSVHFFSLNLFRSTTQRDPKTKSPRLAFPPGGPVTFRDPWKPFGSRSFQLFLLEKRSPNAAKKAKNRSIIGRIWGVFVTTHCPPPSSTAAPASRCRLSGLLMILILLLDNIHPAKPLILNGVPLLVGLVNVPA
jgi:hypothetical protein